MWTVGNFIYKTIKKIIKFHTRPYVIGKTPYAQSASVSEQLVSSDNDESFAYGSSFFQGNLQLSYEWMDTNYWVTWQSDMLNYQKKC